MAPPPLAEDDVRGAELFVNETVLLTVTEQPAPA